MKSPVGRRIVLLSALTCINSAFALEAVDDAALSAADGGAGITFSVTPPTAGIVAQSIYYHDANNAGAGAGIPASVIAGYANQGDLSLSTIGFQGCANATTGATCTTPAGATFNVDIDATSDVDPVTVGNQPALRVNLTWAAGVGKMRVKLAQMGLRNTTGAIATTFYNSVNGYVDLIPASGTPTMTVLLGNEPATGGHMITLANANFGTLDFGQIQLLDNAGGAGRNMNFTFQIENFDLSNATADVSTTGLVLTVPNLSNMNVMVRNIVVGNTTTTMGSLGALGLNISGLTITVNGKS